MKIWHWLAIASPVLAIGGGRSAQAADMLLEFESGATTLAAAASPVAPANESEAEPEHGGTEGQHSANDHPLTFTPVRSEAPVKAAFEAASPVALPPEGQPLPVPTVPPLTAPQSKLPPPPLAPAVTALFEGDSDSLVARAVGSAEGTRTPSGERTLAYYGHVDPGNQAWNQGTFSYQQVASSPAAADQQQLARLKHQTLELHRLAAARGLTLTVDEMLNGIDLANQAPIAALDRGYIDWLSQAKRMGLQGQEAILWARTRSFLDPDTGRWNAPGLGNTVQTITADQARRQRAIAQAIAAHASAVQTELPELADLKPDNTAPETAAIDWILSMDLPALSEDSR